MGDQGTIGTVLVSLSFGRFAVCWLVYVHVQDLCKHEQFEVLDRHSENAVLLDDMELGRRCSEDRKRWLLGPEAAG